MDIAPPVYTPPILPPGKWVRAPVRHASTLKRDRRRRVNTTDTSLGLYRHEFEKDSCGFGLIANMDGKASHWLVQTAVNSLACLTHRGAVAADGKSGDGCGLLMKLPVSFMRAVAAEAGLQLAERFAVGMVFLNQDQAKATAAKQRMAGELAEQGFEVAGWRAVPVDPSACGAEALKTLPHIEQVFVNVPASMDDVACERHLYIARRRSEKAIIPNASTFYVPSLSRRVLSYKGLVMPANLPVFYRELQDERLASDLCVFHQRFSTNTWPEWRLAQPFRYLAHIGEINTIQGNRYWSVARGNKFTMPAIPNMHDIRPLVSMTGSDSSSMDNMLEALLAGGMDIFRAMRLLIPPAWNNVETMDPDLRAFYEYHSMHMEPWDGPAGIVLTDGRYAACVMDRNGLRPARYVVTKDCHITLASEIGVYGYKPEDVVAKGRLRPGEMIAADTHTGKLLLPADIDAMLKSRQPYRQWLKEHNRTLETAKPAAPAAWSDDIQVYQKMFQVTFEERDQVLRVRAEAGQEAGGSLGDDTPMPVLSRQVRSLYDYFRQQFAQVTNPPIDPLREQIVMSLETCLGRERNLFEETPAHAARLVTESPVLSEEKNQKLLGLDDPAYAHERSSLQYDPAIGLRAAIIAVADAAEAAVRAGKVILILSDQGIEQGTLPVHALLATGAVHHRLVNTGLRCDANIVIETATARDPHHFAALIGYGATAVYPYLAYQCLYDMARSGEIKGREPEALAPAFRKGINKGLYKVMSKMGISTVASYRGAQLFEALGLNSEVVALCFTGTSSRIQGGEYHADNPDVVTALRHTVQTGDYADYRKYADFVNQRPVATFRDLLKFREGLTPISVDEVEPIEAILPRFDSAGMSLGALSPEAHEALATAMNRLGGRSNSGEGGEDPARYGTERMSKIKQVASGRFGVTPAYLVNAEVLQIKIAQGAKPGEGGQLPGDKVNKLIARLRYARPGVALISPPPHHDIYSIEDLAQLIFDLKQVNPQALVSVKLVAEPGVGTIAAGVAKAYADLITISGYDGGTGASPLTSIKYAGGAWELGLTETHQTLRRNDLRSKVRLQTDGGLKTGLDVVKAAMLGAESFGFGTGPMIALGCKYLRICHLNNCATGVATQDDNLRKAHFIGLPEMVMNYFRFLAEETREWMALLGVRTMAELIGRTDLLEVKEGETAKQRRLVLTPLLSDGGVPQTKAQNCTSPCNEPFDTGELAEQMVRGAIDAIEHKTGGTVEYKVRNEHRSIGARLSGEIARRHGDKGMEDASITLRLTGTAGQSFGVWNAGGLNLILEGDANDYVGKGMAGGKLVIYPPKGSQFASRDTAIIGNTCLYGATGGKLFASGLAGERFAVRNSGAHAVVEGCGDHGCECMTGGFSFVLDLDKGFVDRYNHERVDIHRVTTEPMEIHRNYLRGVIEEFVSETGSAWGRELLDDFAAYLPRFWLVKPKAHEIKSLLDARLNAA